MSRMHVLAAAVLSSSLAFPAAAQWNLDSPESQGPSPDGASVAEGATLAVVAVPPGFGDGRFTESDLTAVSQYCLWGINQLLAMEGASPLDASAEARMRDYWLFAWSALDVETQAYCSAADRLWLDMQQEIRRNDPLVTQALLQSFLPLVRQHWSGIEAETVQYLAGALPPQQYGLIVQQRYQAMMASPGAGGGAGSGYVTGPGGEVLSGDQIYDGGSVDYESGTSYVMNDGSGDIMYTD